MLQDEFKRLMTLFQEAADGKAINLEEVFAQSLAFFEHLKHQIATGSQEDKIEAMRLMSEMYQQMIATSRRICETTGMSEEQLVSFAENPDNFTPEQWRAIQASKDQIADSGKDLAKLLEGTQQRPSSSKEKKPPHKGPKSQWMRS